MPVRYSRFLSPLIVKWAQIEAEMAGLKLSVRFEDEARFGRITNPASCWAPPQIRPVVPQQAIREYIYAYAAVAPHNGEVDSLILPDMYATTLQIFLDELSNRHLDELILLVMDSAPCHRAGNDRLIIPKNIRLAFQPPYSPEVNPAERLWDELREKFFSNCVFRDMEDVTKHLVSALQWLESESTYTQSLTCFPWIKKALNCIS